MSFGLCLPRAPRFPPARQPRLNISPAPLLTWRTGTRPPGTTRPSMHRAAPHSMPGAGAPHACQGQGAGGARVCFALSRKYPLTLPEVLVRQLARHRGGPASGAEGAALPSEWPRGRRGLAPLGAGRPRRRRPRG